MKTATLLAFAGSVICFAVPASAQKTDTADSEIVQQRDLLGVPKAIDEFGALSLKLEEAFNKNDASAIAALFTEDGILVAPDGTFGGRQAIEKRYADMFHRWPITTFSGQRYQLVNHRCLKLDLSLHLGRLLSRSELCKPASGRIGPRKRRTEVIIRADYTQCPGSGDANIP
jgi:hypothetical protein